MVEEEQTEAVELMLTTDEVKALRALAEHYLDDGAPAFVCMQEWDEPHSAECLRSLRTAILSIRLDDIVRN